MAKRVTINGSSKPCRACKGYGNKEFMLHGHIASVGCALCKRTGKEEVLQHVKAEKQAVYADGAF